jgi:hypothetical protein
MVGKGSSMKVKRILSELRSEREEIEQAILSLERDDLPKMGPTGAGGIFLVPRHVGHDPGRTERRMPDLISRRGKLNRTSN